MRDDRSFLEDILERIKLTNDFVNRDREAFMSSRMMQEAVIRNLEVIGEAARNISEGLRSSYPAIPWRQISAFRNFVVHVYWQINLERIWKVINEDLEELESQVKTILQELEDDEE